MSASANGGRKQNLEVPIMLLPETEFDFAQEQSPDPALLGGLATDDVLCPTTDFDLSPPVPKGKKGKA